MVSRRSRGGDPVRRRPCRDSWRAVSGPLAAVFLAAGVALPPVPALAQIAENEAAARVAGEYDVEVLRVHPGDVDGTPVWLVTVMNPGGDFNTAFQVTTLAVDRASGALVPAYRHGASGVSGTGSAVGGRPDLRPDAMRSGVWR